MEKFNCDVCVGGYKDCDVRFYANRHSAHQHPISMTHLAAKQNECDRNQKEND